MKKFNIFFIIFGLILSGTSIIAYLSGYSPELNTASGPYYAYFSAPLLIVGLGIILKGLGIKLPIPWLNTDVETATKGKEKSNNLDNHFTGYWGLISWSNFILLSRYSKIFLVFL